jgi:hypothetical protein
VLGGVDGVVTTFTVVATSAGGQLSVAAVINLGLANLVVDGFSMGINNFLGTRSRQQAVTRAQCAAVDHRRFPAALTRPSIERFSKRPT